MFKRTPATTAAIVEGRIEQMRVAVPLVRGNVHIVVNGVSVFGAFENSADIRTLQGLQQQGVPVRVGVLDGPQSLRHFSWLSAAQGPGIPPRYYVDLRRRAWRSIGIGTALAAALIGGCFLLDLGSFIQVLMLVVALTVALFALILAGCSLYGLWDNRLHRPAILQSEAKYRQQQGRPVSPGAAASSAASAPQADKQRLAQPQFSERLVADASPEILHVHGVLTSLTHEARPGTRHRPSSGVYRFQVGRQPYALHVGEDLGNVQPFLAEGDRIELAAYAGEIPGAGPHRLVYGLRNREDDRVYVCHRHFRGAHTRIGPVGVGLSQRVPMLALLGSLLLVTWLVVVGFLHFGGSPQEHADLPELAAFLFAILLFVWACFAVPLLYLDTRWRLGRPTRRQRILERIYRTLDLGTPFAPKVRIEEV
ncbi:hypothetical protein [Achromobacter deleyi]|uniref:hypothetical protein n=1 Tax=Achromobacter deleyi TaxID=1353891 RepID=UPI001465E04F|nr:hypothetical protein [Achromobacter deleyi]CAB3907592.1 hypothetical protein LMG3412_04571 [Achromobacter deleyi]